MAGAFLRSSVWASLHRDGRSGQAEVETAEADVGVNHVAEGFFGDMPEGAGTEPCTRHYAAYTVEVAVPNSRGEKSVSGAYKRHGAVAQQKVGGTGGHVALLVGLGREEVERGRRSLHGEESAHQSAQHAGADLYAACGRQSDSPAEEGEVKCGKYEHCAQDLVQQGVVNAREAAHGYGRYGDEREQDGYELSPVYEPAHP